MEVIKYLMSLITTCPSCETEYKHVEAARHKEQCPGTFMICPIPRCGKRVMKNDYAKHQE